MTLREALHFFDSVECHPEYPDQAGMVKCCGLPVVMRGGARVECSRCGRAVSIVGRQWMLTEDGTRGIPIRPDVLRARLLADGNEDSLHLAHIVIGHEFERLSEGPGKKGDQLNEISSQASEEHVRRKRRV